MSKRNGRPIHANMLKPSPPLAVQLAEQVEDGFVRLLNIWLRTRGERLLWPVSINDDVFRWREMRLRHKAGDYRNTEAELKAMEAVAQWTAEKYEELRNERRT